MPERVALEVTSVLEPSPIPPWAHSIQDRLLFHDRPGSLYAFNVVVSPPVRGADLGRTGGFLIKSGHKRKETQAHTKSASVSTGRRSKHLHLVAILGAQEGVHLGHRRARVRKHLIPVLGEVPWSRLTQAHVDHLVAAAQKCPRPGTSPCSRWPLGTVAGQDWIRLLSSWTCRAAPQGTRQTS